MSGRWVCPNCRGLSERLYYTSESKTAMSCPICDWVYMKSMWGETWVPDGVATILESDRGEVRDGTGGWKRLTAEEPYEGPLGKGIAVLRFESDV